MLGLARRLAVLGHQVRFLTGPAYAHAVRGAGAEFVPLGLGAGFTPSQQSGKSVGIADRPCPGKQRVIE